MKVGLLVLVILILAIWVINVFKQSKVKHVLAPIPKKTVEKYLGGTWDIDIHNHIFRFVERGKTCQSVEQLVGAIKMDNEHIWRLGVKPGLVRRQYVVDIFEYDYREKKIGQLIHSLLNPREVTLNSPKLALQTGHWYLPVIRVGGVLSRIWINQVYLTKSVASLDWKWKGWVTSASENWSNSNPVEVNDEDISHCPENHEQVIPWMEYEVYPPSQFIQKRAALFNIEGGQNVCMVYRDGHQGISARINGQRVEEIGGEGSNTIKYKRWALDFPNEGILVETSYGPRGSCPLVLVSS